MISTGTKYFCKNLEEVENYDIAVNDKSQTWECHHRLETHTSDGERRLVNLSKQELIALDMYYYRPAEELIFLTAAEHRHLHHKGKKLQPFSEEHRRKMSEAKKGKKHSEKAIAKMSAAHKGQSSAVKGKHWKLVDGKRVWY